MTLYLLLLFLILFGFLVYDIAGGCRYKEYAIYATLALMVFISGFAYRLGGDGMMYVMEYKNYGTLSDLSIPYLFGFHGRQPGWVLLCTICKTITSDYWLFKLTHAFIVNTAYVIAIRRHTNYVFSGLLAYYVLIFFNQNFQILRESLAISIFLLSLPSFYENKWIKYYLFAFLAFFIHEGAAFLFLLPLIKILGFNKYSIALYIGCSLLFAVYASDLLQLFMTLALSGDIDNDKFYFYFHDLDSSESTSGLGNVILNLIIPFSILLYYKVKGITISYFYLALFSLIIYTLSMVLPIVYRFGNYVLIFNYLLLIDFLFTWFSSFKYSIKYRLAFVSIILFSYIGFKSRIYFIGNYGETRFKEYVQYFPYASVFEEYEDPEREVFIKQLDQ